jgi:hypothetical protein
MWEPQILLSCKGCVKLWLTSSLGDSCNNTTCTTVSHFIVSCEVSMIGGSTVQWLQNVWYPVSIQLHLLPVAMVSLVTEHITCVKICNILKLADIYNNWGFSRSTSVFPPNNHSTNTRNACHSTWHLGDHPSRLSRDSPENLRQIPLPAFCMKYPANFLFHNIFNHFKF